MSGIRIACTVFRWKTAREEIFGVNTVIAFIEAVGSLDYIMSDIWIRLNNELERM
jgi:hypothetical protein